MHLSEQINALWKQGLNEHDIAPRLSISQSAVLFARRGKVDSPPPVETPVGVETRTVTTLGWGGSRTCRRVAVTLAYSGTMQ